MKYFIYADNRQQGPFSIEELAARGLSSETLVWAEGMEQWTPAWKIKELKDIIEGKVQAQPVPPPLPATPPYGDDKDSTEQTRNDETDGREYTYASAGNSRTAYADETEEITYEPHRRSIGGRMTGIIIAVVIAFALTVTCPTRDQHCEAVADEISKALKSSGGSSDFWGMFSNIFASGVVNMAVNQFLDVDNYYLFSIGTINIEGKSRAVSFGILNHVFTFDNDYIREALNEERMAE